MEKQSYQHVLKFLQENEIPYHVKTEQQRKKFRNYCKAFEEIEGKLFWKNKFGLDRRVLKEDEIQAYLYLYHDDPLSGHLGPQKVYKKLRRNYYWPNMFREIENYIRTCPQCQIYKGPEKPQTATIEPT